MATTRKRHDALFRQTFGDPSQAASLLRAALPEGIQRQADWSTLRLCNRGLFRSVFAERTNDLLFAMEIAGAEAYVYVLLEHQSTSNRWMALRMLEYIVFI
jgi:predicted transposase/invertase (TIGR01784 family)